MKQINIALLGLGTVGQGVVHILEDNQQKLVRVNEANFKIIKALVRNPAKHQDFADKIELVTDFNDILNDPKINLVIEVMGGIEPTFSYLSALIKNGKNIISANKDLLASKGQELIKLAENNSVSFRYEAAVAGGIPILNTLRQSFASDQIKSVTGIINGTSNYILTKMTEENLSFNQALKLAQENGFAEADPKNDIEGLDAAYKLAILTDFAFGTSIRLSDIATNGIKAVTEKDIKIAKQLSYRIKLLANSHLINGKIAASVRTFFVNDSLAFSQINNEVNAIEITSKYLGKTMFSGAGAGSLPTANSVVSDLLIEADNLNNGKAKRFNKYHQPREVISDSSKYEYVIIFKDNDDALVTDEMTNSEIQTVVDNLQAKGQIIENIYPIY